MLNEKQNPPLSWPPDTNLSDFVGCWWVAHTKSRNEKALANDLVAKDISYFLPMSWKTHYTRGRKMKSLLPLFKSYLFFCGSENQRVEALRTNRVANTIEVKNQQRLIDELANIQQALSAGVDLAPHECIKTGQNCRVKSGPLMGMEGIVENLKNSTKLVLKINMLGQAASVEIDTDLIEIID